MNQLHSSLSTVRALQAATHGDKKGAAMNVAFAAMEGLSLVGGLRNINSGYSAGKPASTFGFRAARMNTALVTKYPGIPALPNTTDIKYLYPGEVIDRFGSSYGQWFSTPGTSYGARSIPEGLTPYSTYEVLKPFHVESSLASPGFFNGQIGGGIQYRSPVSPAILEKRGIIRTIKVQY